MEKKEKEIKIDLACGNNKKEGFVGIDVAQTPSVDIVHDLNVYPWPIEDNSVDEIWCSHYVEHIPHNIGGQDKRDGLIQFMDEVYRILKVGGKVTIITPYFSSERAFGDPTHCRFINNWTYFYYNKEWRDLNKLSHYGIKCDFDIVTSYVVEHETSLRAKEVLDEKIKRELNVVNDIIAEMTKR